MSEKTIKLILRILLGSLMGISVIIAILFVAQLTGAESAEAEKAVAQPMLYWTYCLLAIAAATAVLFPLVSIIQNPKKALKVLVSLAFLGVIFLVSYLVASGSPIETATSSTNPDFSDPSILKMAGMGLYATYILFGLAIVLLVVSGVKNLFKNM